MVAALITRRQGKSTKTWVVGGAWTPGDALQDKPKRIKAIIQEQGLPPDRVSWVWVPETKQVGLFEFEGKPRRALSLAAHLAALLPSGKLPWRGVFNLGPAQRDGDDLWWVVAFGSTGDVAPGWDVVGTHDDVLDLLSERTSEIAMIPHGENFSTPEESWAFLDQDAPDFMAVPASSTAAASSALKVLVPVAALAVAAAGGGLWWKHHREQQLLAQQASAARLAQETAQRLTAQHLAQQQAQEQQVKAAWANLPRPWVAYPSWAQVMQSCQVGPLSENGWGLTAVDCVVSPAGLQITRSWVRTPLANVDKPPAQAQIAPDGNTATTVQTVALSADAHGTTPAAAAAAQLRWLSLTQRWSHVIAIRAEQPQAFVAPWPPNTPPEVQKALAPPPVLWKTLAVSITPTVTHGLVQPSDDNNPLNQTNFVPTQVQITLGLVPTMTLKGIQYAAP